jgi:hypothetical protein
MVASPKYGTSHCLYILTPTGSDNIIEKEERKELWTRPCMPALRLALVTIQFAGHSKFAMTVSSIDEQQCHSQQSSPRSNENCRGTDYKMWSDTSSSLTHYT